MERAASILLLLLLLLALVSCDGRTGGAADLPGPAPLDVAHELRPDAPAFAETGGDTRREDEAGGAPDAGADLAARPADGRGNDAPADVPGEDAGGPGTCHPPCAGPRPVCLDGVCVECLSDEHCPCGTCDAVTRTCACSPCDGACRPPLPACFDETCVECHYDSDCPGEELCDRLTHRCVEDWRCLGYECREPLLACVIHEDQPACVPCRRDHHCPWGYACDEETYSCVRREGPPPSCIESGCPEVEGVEILCDEASGLCHTRDGRCDDWFAFCHVPSGSECFGPLLLPGSRGRDELLEHGQCSCDVAATTACTADPRDPACDEGPRCFPGQLCLPIMTKELGATPQAFCVAEDFVVGPR